MLPATSLPPWLLIPLAFTFIVVLAFTITIQSTDCVNAGHRGTRRCERLLRTSIRLNRILDVHVCDKVACVAKQMLLQLVLRDSVQQDSRLHRGLDDVASALFVFLDPALPDLNSLNGAALWKVFYFK